MMHKQPLTIGEKLSNLLLVLGIVFFLFYFLTWDFIISIIISIVITISVIVVYIWIKKLLKKKEIPSENIEQMIEQATPYEFEEIICNMYQRLGYKTTLTRKAKDYGTDIIMTKKGIMYVVQVKHYREGKKVDRSSLQKLQGSARHYHAKGMKFVTSSFFTSPALDYAYQHGIETIDYNELISLVIRSYKKKHRGNR